MSGKLRDTGAEDVRIEHDQVRQDRYNEYLKRREADHKRIETSANPKSPYECPDFYHRTEALPAAECTRLMKTFYTQGQKDKGRIAGGHVKAGTRQVDIYHYEDPDVHDLLVEMFNDCNSQKFFDFDIKSIEYPHMCVYHGNQRGHYKWHKDAVNFNDYRRCISLSLLLNDGSEFQGGDLELFLGIDEEGGPHVYQPKLQKAGDLCFFKSSMFHRVKPVTQGTRVALVTWAWGEWGNRQK